MLMLTFVEVKPHFVKLSFFFVIEILSKLLTRKFEFLSFNLCEISKNIS